MIPAATYPGRWVDVGTPEGLAAAGKPEAAEALSGVGDAADVLLFGPVPSNAVIVDVLVMNDDLDAHATPTLEGDWGL